MLYTSPVSSPVAFPVNKADEILATLRWLSTNPMQAALHVFFLAERPNVTSGVSVSGANRLILTNTSTFLKRLVPWKKYGRAWRIAFLTGFRHRRAWCQSIARTLPRLGAAFGRGLTTYYEGGPSLAILQESRAICLCCIVHPTPEVREAGVETMEAGHHPLPWLNYDTPSGFGRPYSRGR